MFTFSACVSKKKYRELISNNDRTVKLLQDKVDAGEALIYQLRLDLAGQKGENRTLVALQDKQQARIDSLKKNIENLNFQAVNQQRSMDVALQEKSAEIALREQTLESLKLVIDKRQADLDQIGQDIRTALPDLIDQAVTVQVGDGKLSVCVSKDIMFRTGATGKIEKEGAAVLSKISEILLTYPEMNVVVIGHTDNSPPPRNSINDNWTYSALRAATVVLVLTEEFDLAPNRVMLAGMSEFSPRASNATPAGRALNHRIELVIAPREENLLLEVRRKLD